MSILILFGLLEASLEFLRLYVYLNGPSYNMFQKFEVSMYLVIIISNWQ